MVTQVPHKSNLEIEIVFRNLDMEIRENRAKNGLEIMFPKKPAAAVLDTLKDARFRFHRKYRYWYRKRDRIALATADRLIARATA